jgi:hypothetical protein
MSESTDRELCFAANWETLIFRGSASNWDQVNIVAEAIAEVRRQHADFDVLNPVMLAVAKGFTPNLSEIAPAQYIEAVPMSTRKM